MLISDSVEQRNGGYYVAGTPVSLDSVAACFLDGNSPATIQQDFSAPILERSMERSKFYLVNQGEVDENMRQGEPEIRRVVRLLSEMDPEAYAGLMRLRE